MHDEAMGAFAVDQVRMPPMAPEGAKNVAELIGSSRLGGGVHLPLSIPRFRVEGVASALGLSLDDARAQLEALVAAHSSADALTKRLGRCARRHVDGAYSFSYSPSTYESQRYPDAHEIEALVARHAFGELDAALSATCTKAPAWEASAPSLVWADGTRLSPGARAWFLAPIGAKQTYNQLAPRDANKPVRGAHDLLRFGLDDASMRAFARWLLTTRIKNGPRAFPLAPAALGEAALWLREKRSLAPFVLVDLMNEVAGRRLLLAAGLIGPARLDLHCHDAWPAAPEGRALAEWVVIAERFLDEATKRGLRISSDALRTHYLGRPWLATLVRARAWAVEGAPIELTELPPRRNVHLVDRRTFDEVAPPTLGLVTMSVAEWKRRCARAGLTLDREYDSAPYAFAVDPLGTFKVTPTGYGAGWGGHDKEVRLVSLDADQNGRARWRCSETENVGWSTLDPTWRALIGERLRILDAPVRARASKGR